jgi:hypothetical protein
MQASLAIARETADANKIAAEAAKTSADIAKQALFATRARLSFDRYVPAFKFDDHNNLLAISLVVAWRNTGGSSAIGIAAKGDMRIFPVNKFQEPDFSNSVKMLVAPMIENEVGVGAHCHSAETVIPTDVLIGIRKGQLRVFLWDYVGYFDVFEPSVERHTETCIELELIDDPTIAAKIGEFPGRYKLYGTKFNSVT